MRRRGKHLEVSTFPFLAVLLCAMGSLILVLLVMDRKAKLAARYKAMAVQTQTAEERARADAARRDLVQQREREARAAWEQKRDALHATVDGQHQAVQNQLKNVGDQLAAAAARLKAELDDSAKVQKRVESERVRLASEETALATTRQEVTEAAAQSAAERAAQAKMTADLVHLETALKDLQEARERDRQTYSVVPYHGKHGERCRPLYVECTRQGVVFHPERVEVPVVLDPGAARAEVERRVKRQQEYLASIQAKADDKPYLMLLVRPDGIDSYYALQRAVHGIDLEFGYEFVDAAWVFDFTKELDGPPVQPPLANAPNKVSPIPVIGRVGPMVALMPTDTNASGARPDDGIGAGRPGLPKPAVSGSRGNGIGLNPAVNSGGPGTLPGSNRNGPSREGVAGPFIGSSEVASGGPSGQAGPLSLNGGPVPSGPPAGLPPPGHAATGGVAGSGATTGAGMSPTSMLPTLPEAGTTSTGVTNSSRTVDPPYSSGKTQTEFATQGKRPSVPTNGVSGQGNTPAIGNAPSETAGSALAPGVTGSTNATSTPGQEASGHGNPTGQQNPAPSGKGGSNPAGNGSTNPPVNAEKDTSPRFAPTQAAPAKKPPPPLRVARLSGDRDYVIFIECRPDDVVLFPARQSFSIQQLQRGDPTLLQAVKQMIDRKQSLVRPGELPFRPQVRYLVHPESIRSYHSAYPILNALGAPQTRQNLEADDDAAAIVVGQ